MAETISNNQHFGSAIPSLADDATSYDDEVIDENNDVVIVVSVCVFCKKISYIR